MAGDKRMDGEEAVRLNAMIEQNHPKVMQAYSEYVDSQVTFY